MSDAPEGRHSTVWPWPIPGDAALVELFVAGAVEVLFAVWVAIPPEPAALPPTPAVEDDPLPERALVVRLLPAAEASELDVAEDPDDADVVPVELEPPLVELVAILSIVALRPAEPAEAAPVDDPEPPPDVLGGVETVTVGVLVKVAPVVADGLLPALVRVCPEVTVDDCAALDGVVLDGDTVGTPDAPLPTWPCPPLPGTGPPTG